MTTQNQETASNQKVPSFIKNAGDVTPPPSEGAGGRLFWFLACAAADIPENGGGCVKYGDKQIAVFNFTRRGEWYATDNMCPHRMQMALSRGMIGTQGDEPKVACPFHKKTFSLETGACLNGDDYQIKTYPVKVEDGLVYISLPQPPPKEGAFELAK